MREFSKAFEQLLVATSNIYKGSLVMFSFLRLKLTKLSTLPDYCTLIRYSLARVSLYAAAKMELQKFVKS